MPKRWDDIFLKCLIPNCHNSLIIKIPCVLMGLETNLENNNVGMHLAYIFPIFIIKNNNRLKFLNTYNTNNFDLFNLIFTKVNMVFNLVQFSWMHPTSKINNRLNKTRDKVTNHSNYTIWKCNILKWIGSSLITYCTFISRKKLNKCLEVSRFLIFVQHVTP